MHQGTLPNSLYREPLSVAQQGSLVQAEVIKGVLLSAGYFLLTRLGVQTGEPT